MAKTVARRTNKTKASLEVKTPYPKKEKKVKSDNDYWGEKMVKLQDRVNELELTVSDINNKLKVVTGRMGL